MPACKFERKIGHLNLNEVNNANQHVEAIENKIIINEITYQNKERTRREALMNAKVENIHRLQKESKEEEETVKT